MEVIDVDPVQSMTKGMGTWSRIVQKITRGEKDWERSGCWIVHSHECWVTSISAKTFPIKEDCELPLYFLDTKVIFRGKWLERSRAGTVEWLGSHGVEFLLKVLLESFGYAIREQDTIHNCQHWVHWLWE